MDDDDDERHSFHRIEWIGTMFHTEATTGMMHRYYERETTIYCNGNSWCRLDHTRTEWCLIDWVPTYEESLGRFCITRIPEKLSKEEEEEEYERINKKRH